MPNNLTAQVNGRHLLSSEMRPRMAKADLRKAEIAQPTEEIPQAWRERIGSAVDRARLLAGLSLKEFADVIGRDERQVARWISGGERPQFDVIFAVVRLRGALVIALAELADDVNVTTTITIRKVG